MFGEFSPPINTAPYQSKKLKMQSKISVGINRRLINFLYPRKRSKFVCTGSWGKLSLSFLKRSAAAIAASVS